MILKSVGKWFANQQVKKFKIQPKTEVYISTQESHCFKFGYKGVHNKRRFQYKGKVTSRY